MRLLQQVPEAAMVAAFLKAEIGSARLSNELRGILGKLGVCESVLLCPDLTSESENTLRAKTLSAYRGYQEDREIFAGFPTGLTWYKAELPLKRVPDLLYVDYPEWRLLTGGTRRVGDAILKMLQGTLPAEVANHTVILAADKIPWGQTYTRDPLIVWAQSVDEPFTILEGHHRSTSLTWQVFQGFTDPAIVHAIVGLYQPVPQNELVPDLRALTTPLATMAIAA